MKMTFNPKNLYLERVGGGPNFRAVSFDKPVSVLGRHETCDLIVGGRTVSRKHCEFTFENGKLYVKNISTSTCTYLNEDKVLEKTEVELEDLIGLGSRDTDGHEVYVYRCCVIPTVDLVSDEESEVGSKSSQKSASLRPTHLDSPGFSSDTSTATIRNRRDHIQTIADDLSEPNEHNLKPCSVPVKKLNFDDINKYARESQPSTSKDQTAANSLPKIQKETPSNNEKPSEAVPLKAIKKKEKSPKKLKPPKASLAFSRTKYEAEKKVKKIKRRMSKLVDPDSDDNEEKKAKKAKGPLKLSKDRQSMDTKKDRTSIDSKKAGTSQRKESKSSRIEEKKNGHDTTSKSKKQTDSVQTSNTSTKRTQETKTDQNCNEVIQTKRSRSNSHSASDSDAPLKKAARVSPPQRPSTSSVGEVTFDFPALEDTTEKLKTDIKRSKPPPRRHQSMYVECAADMPKRQSSVDNLMQDQQSKIIKKNNEIRKQIRDRTKSVGERPPLPNVVEDRKQKLRDLAVTQQKQEVQRKISISESKGNSTGTVKVKVTAENRGNFLTQDIPKARPAKPVAKKPDPPKSAAEAFRDKHVKEGFQPQATSSPLNGNSVKFYEPLNDTLDINIEVPAPTLNVFNQPMSMVSTPQVTMSMTSSPQVTMSVYRQEQPSEIVNTPTTSSAQLTPFPNVILNPTIFERTKGMDELKSILKSPLDRTTKSLRVSFKENIREIKVVARYINEMDNDDVQIQPSAQQRPSLKDLEISIPEEIMGWPTEWLDMSEIPKQWFRRSMKKSYDSLEEYKDIIKPLMRIELFSKMKSTNASKKDWSPFLLRSKIFHGNRQRLILDLSSQSSKNIIFKIGLLLIVKVNQTTKNSSAALQQPKDLLFFGYVTAISESTLTVDTMNRDLPPNISVLKCKPLLYINTDIRSMVAIDNIQESALTRKFLDPGSNKLLTSTDDNNLFLKINSMLEEDQKHMVNVITAECLKERNDSYIISLCSMAGTGKTRILIESLVNIIRCSKKDDIPCSILVCTMSNVLTDQIAVQTAKHQSLHKNDKLARVGESKEIGLAAQELYKRIDDNLRSYDVIFTTVTHAHELYNYIDHFDICFIDDANMVIDAELAILLQFNIKKLFLIGDIMQQQPMIQSAELKNSKYDETCFARMVNFFKDNDDEDKPILQLKSQHRMCKELAAIAEKFIYKKNNVDNNTIQSVGPQELNHPFLMIGINASELLNKFQLLEVITSKWEDIYSTVDHANLAIIVADEGNKRYVESKLDLRRMDATVCSINNITFQEKDAIIIIAATKDEIGSMCRYNKLNKAITRAKYAVRIVGISTFFDGNISFGNLWNKLALGNKEKFYRQFVRRDYNDNVQVMLANY